MATQQEREDSQSAVDHAEETAAFEASFDATDAGPVANNPAPAEQDPAKDPAAAQATPTPTVTEAAPTAPIPKADDSDVRAELRKLHGRIGSLNDQLQQTLKAKEAEGKPAVLTPVALARLKAEYPEMADMLEGDIADVIANIAQKKVDPAEIAAMVTKQVEVEKFAMRQESITDRHDTWVADCWADQIGGNRTPQYAAWLMTLPAGEADTFENSMNPAFVNRKLDQFYDWKGKQAQAMETTARTQAEKQQRLKGAITPTGTTRASSTNLSDEEAANKAFQDAYEN